MNVRTIAAGLIALAVAAAPVAMEGQRNPRDSRSNKPATKFSGYEVGPTPVGAIPDVRLKDKDRNKEIELTIEYPTRGKDHPLLVLTPGFGGTHRSYVGLSSYWAGNNYVVIRLNHAEKTEGIKSTDDVWARLTPADWKNRVRDITVVLDSIGALTKDFPELEGKIDANKIAVVGHGYGAHTAMLIAGARTFPGNASYADPRVKAVIFMSPPGPSEKRGLTKDSWLELKIPAMFMTGSLDRGLTDDETPEWRTEAFRLSPDGDKWLVNLTGAGAATFAGGNAVEQLARLQRQQEEERQSPNIPTAPDPDDPDGRIPRTGRAPTTRDVMRESPNRNQRADLAALKQRDIFANIRGIALTFLDTYLHGDAEARAALEKVPARTEITLEKK